MGVFQRTVMSIDAVTLTVFLPFSKLDKYLDILGLLDGLEHAGHGTKGFQDQYNGVAAFRLGANPGMGREYCSLFMLGQCLDHVGIERLQSLITALTDDQVRYQVRRLDVALDTQDFAVSDLAEAQAAGLVECGVRVLDEHKNVNRSTGEVVGHTLYFGSRQSSAMLRVYHKLDGSSFGTEPFTRVEMEYKQERADLEFHQLLAADLEDWAGIAGASLRGFMEVATEWWRAWMDGVGRAWIKLRRPAQTVERVRRWLYHQVAPTLAAYVGAASAGEVELIELELRQLVDHGARRMRDRHKRLLSAPVEENRTRYRVSAASILG